MTTYELGALAIVLAMPLAVVAVLAGGWAWAADSVRRSSTVGGLGVLATLVAVGHLFVEQTCSVTSNRPILMAILGPGDCRRTGLVAVELVLLLAVSTAVAVRLPGAVGLRR